MQNGYDLVVIGGGLAGVSCALRTAQKGRQVLLVERRPALGWESSWAGQLDYSGVHSPIAKEIVDEVRRVGGLRGNTADGPILEIALDRLLREAGISVLLYSYPLRLIYEDEYAFGVLMASRCGEQAVRARVMVDATEEGVKPGDLLTTSTVPGHAMKAANYTRAQGAILGKAMDSLEKGRKGQILVLVTLQ